MDVLSFTDPKPFAELVAPVIARDPAFASVLATNLDHALHAPGFGSHWFLIRDDEQVIGAAMHTPPYPLHLTPLPDPQAGTPALAAAVQRTGLPLAGVNGPVAAVQPFVDAWRQRTGAESRVTGTDRLYEMVTPPAPLKGRGATRPATEADLELATTWLQAYEVEIEHGPLSPDPAKVVRRRLTRGHLLFWETSAVPVSMAGISRPLAGVARVGGVYTPLQHRGQGFGSAVTVAATRQGFADGARRCVLYADLANPTSNRIYQAIGYRPVGDSTTVSFDPPPAG